ncbi:capsular exopolysaccharide synthesis family protein [Thermoflavifilum aggregans]|uniref:non-specific protein-tyrosine kinase n=1 Tax=Thermoflavifilum aggregans TaxID=454188 RepID=A0A2M9CS93_9BACT|nr:tyrosine-protein kinase [Thermoflavifilum aggregans]PJJ74678.1 capsular exopolysaccharide synthesis family protein [Thermoflavifilum aggregans]
MANENGQDFFQPDAQQQMRNLRETLWKYLLHWPLFVVFLVLAGVLAWLYLSYQAPVYEIHSTMIVKTQSNTLLGDANSSNPQAPFSQLIFPNENMNLDDEIALMKSEFFLSRVVARLQLQEVYLKTGQFRDLQLFDDAPFHIQVIHIADSNKTYRFQIQLPDDHHFLINRDPQPYSFNSLIFVGSSVFRIQRSSGAFDADARYQFTWVPVRKAIEQLNKNLNIIQKNTSSSVLDFTYQTPYPREGEKILNTLMEEYIRYSVEEKSQIAQHTYEFVSQRIQLLEHGLGAMESNLQQFRKQNQLLDLDQQSTQYLSSMGTLQERLQKADIQLQLLNMLETEIRTHPHQYNLTPTNLGIEDMTLTALIAQYNQLALRRQNELQQTTPDNPIIRKLESSLDDLQAALIQNLQTLQHSYELTRNQLKEQLQAIQNTALQLPEKEDQLNNIRQAQLIKNALYTYLLQKREEIGIQLASIAPDGKIFSSATAGNFPVAPRRRTVAIVALLFAFAFPVGIIYVKDMLNDKVMTRADVRKHATLGIIGEIGHSRSDEPLVVLPDSRDMIAEQFRILRANLIRELSVIPHAPLIMICSSFAGEGKSFLSCNLASSFALRGQRVLLMEFDLRKPKLMERLQMPVGKGIADVLRGKADLSAAIQQVPQVDQLFVISAGSLPSNPAELILSATMPALIKKVREQFDLIVIDTPPVSFVSDAFILGEYADLTLLVVRQRFTLRRHVEMLEDLHQQKRFARPFIVVNDVKWAGYQGYYQYGYGYYGANGYGYYISGRRRKSIRSWLQS